MSLYDCLDHEYVVIPSHANLVTELEYIMKTAQLPLIPTLQQIHTDFEAAASAAASTTSPIVRGDDRECLQLGISETQSVVDKYSVTRHIQKSITVTKLIDACHSHRRRNYVMIVHGPAGCGKTTLLKKLAKQYNVALIDYEIRDYNASSKDRDLERITKEKSKKSKLRFNLTLDCNKQAKTKVLPNRTKMILFDGLTGLDFHDAEPANLQGLIQYIRQEQQYVASQSQADMIPLISISKKSKSNSKMTKNVVSGLCIFHETKTTQQEQVVNIDRHRNETNVKTGYTKTTSVTTTITLRYYKCHACTACRVPILILCNGTSHPIFKTLLDTRNVTKLKCPSPSTHDITNILTRRHPNNATLIADIAQNCQGNLTKAKIDCLMWSDTSTNVNSTNSTELIKHRDEIKHEFAKTLEQTTIFDTMEHVWTGLVDPSLDYKHVKLCVTALFRFGAHAAIHILHNNIWAFCALVDKHLESVWKNYEFSSTDIHNGWVHGHKVKKLRDPEFVEELNRHSLILIRDSLMRMLSTWLVYCSTIYDHEYKETCATTSTKENNENNTVLEHDGNDTKFWSALLMLKQFLQTAYRPRCASLWKNLIKSIKDNRMSLTDNTTKDNKCNFEPPENRKQQLDQELFFASSNTKRKLLDSLSYDESSR